MQRNEGLARKKPVLLIGLAGPLASKTLTALLPTGSHNTPEGASAVPTPSAKKAELGGEH